MVLYHPSYILYFLHTDATNSLKTSVSNGKSAVASAITDKGVSTSATATFDTMASNIRAISTLEISTDENSGYITTVSYNGVKIILHKSTPRPKKVSVTLFAEDYYASPKPIYNGIIDQVFSLPSIGTSNTSNYSYNKYSLRYSMDQFLYTSTETSKITIRSFINDKNFEIITISGLPTNIHREAGAFCYSKLIY